ncbi:RimK/LysX family protein [uncultured Eudoraea sp.]|uniref:ATP-dependent zinc protease family protein n=1 Tax=uncultured Eudoraea sp. TaxID=1035614 RepID=UPI0026276EE6|nr:RimK/LysX family protein [uncultured Eudoraea sp.]
MKLIGSEEWCAFEQLNIPAIRARVDSGARTSSIQAKEIKLIKKNGEDWVSFTVCPLQKNTKVQVQCSAKVLGRRSIKGSFGISEDRLIIKTPITIGKDTFDVELSLANRNTMEFRMLLGREAMTNRFIINPAVKHLQKKYLRKEVTALYKS